MKKEEVEIPAIEEEEEAAVETTEEAAAKTEEGTITLRTEATTAVIGDDMMIGGEATTAIGGETLSIKKTTVAGGSRASVGTAESVRPEPTSLKRRVSR